MLRSKKQISPLFFFLVCTALVSLTMACKSTESSSNVNEDMERSTVDSLNSEIQELEANAKQDQYDSKRDSVSKVLKAELYNEYQTDANRLSTFYILAQQRFYGAEYEEALFLINQAARIKASPDVLALKGSIYLGLGSIDDFVTNWREALTLDSNVPIPPAPAVVRELKKQGLINDNLERNF